MTGFVGTPPISRRGKLCQVGPSSDLSMEDFPNDHAHPCRFGFAHDVEVETQKVKADIHRMQQQLQLFDNHTDVTSAHVQKHAVDPNSPVHPVQDGSVPAPALLTPFLFVGVLSVAKNAGNPHSMPRTCHSFLP